MAFPDKFRALVELGEKDVSIPDFVWLSYAVCAVEEESCGWRGWIIESAWKIDPKTRKEMPVEADTHQRCPVCGRQLYRTGVEKQFRLNRHAGPKIDYPYASVPVTFTTTTSKNRAKKKRATGNRKQK